MDELKAAVDSLAAGGFTNHADAFAKANALEYDLGDVYLESAGRILQLNVNLKNVCPRKRVALAIALSEVDQQGNEYQRGTKTLTIPAHFSTSCRDVLVKCVKFI